MAELWGIPEVRSWWLPESEGYSPIIRNVRSIIENRTPQNLDPRKTEDVRNMKAIFAKMSVNDVHCKGTTVNARDRI